MSNIEVRGKQEFMDMEIPVVEGGFGEGQKAILAKTIAKIHDMRMDKVNALINDNIDEFEFGVDILDLKSVGFENLTKVSELFTQNGFNASKNIYLLSEQGYMLLVGFMRTDKAKQIRKQLRREYFTMREIINSDEQLKGLALLKVAEGKTMEDRISGATQYAELVTKPLKEKIELDKPKVTFAERVMNTKDNVTVTVLSKMISDEGFNISNRKLYDKLREWGYIYKRSRLPIQKYVEKGYFVVKLDTIDTAYGVKEVNNVKVTPKGQIHIVERILEENKIVA